MAPIKSDVLCPNSETAAAQMSATPAMSKPYSTSAAPFLFLNSLLNTVFSPGLIGELPFASRRPAEWPDGSYRNFDELPKTSWPGGRRRASPPAPLENPFAQTFPQVAARGVIPQAHVPPRIADRRLVCRQHQ